MNREVVYMLERQAIVASQKGQTQLASQIWGKVEVLLKHEVQTLLEAIERVDSEVVYQLQHGEDKELPGLCAKRKRYVNQLSKHSERLAGYFANAFSGDAVKGYAQAKVD